MRIVKTLFITLTFCLIATTARATNLVTNGDFSSGNTGFTTSYSFQASKPPDLDAGRYGVSDQAFKLHNAFSTNYGHTTGQPGDNYFIANGGAGAETEVVWRTPEGSPIVLDEDLVYRFEAYITKVFPANPPTLRFQLGDGTSWMDLGDTPALDDDETGAWVFTFADGRFSEGGNYYLRLINMETAQFGNDFGIDDIYFGLRSDAPSIEEEPGVPDDDVRIFTLGAPNVTAGQTTQFRRQGSVAVAPTIYVSDTDNSKWNGGSLQVSISAGSETQDALSLPIANPGGGAIWLDTGDGNSIKTNTTAIGTANAAFVTDSTAWIITFNASATNALVQNTARAILFDSPAPAGTANRTVAFTATNNDSLSRGDTQTIRIVLPTQLELTGPPTVLKDSLGRVRLAALDADSIESPVTEDTIVDLGSSGSGIFYSDAAGTLPITQVTIPAGSSSAVVYYRGDTFGTPTLTAAVASGMALDAGSEAIRVSGDNALSFNGSNHVRIDSTLGLGRTNVTIEAWVYLQSTSARGTVARLGSSDSGFGIGVGSGSFDNLGNNLIVLIDAVRWIDTGRQIGTGWHHIAFSVGAQNQVNIYLDGENVYTEASAGAAPMPLAPSYIGAGNATVRLFSDGKIDEVRYWGAVRSADEIRANMHRQLRGNEAGLTGYFKLDTGTGSTALDSSGNNQNGTLVGGPVWQTSGAMSGPGNALSFDGTDDHAVCGDVGSGVRTLEFWVNPTTATQSFLDLDGGTHLVRANDGTVTAEGFSSPTILINGVVGGHLAHGRWNHVAVTTATGIHASALTLARSGINYLNGQMDGVRLWSTARTPAQIRDNMAKSLQGDEPGLMAYYRSDQSNWGGQTRLYDQTPNARHCSLTNMNLATAWMPSGAFNTWVGSDSTGWASAANWSRAAVPLDTDNVGILDYASSIGYPSGNALTLSGTPRVNHFILATNAAASLSSSLTVNGNWINNGVFTPNTHRVTLGGGNQTLVGVTTFYDLNKTVASAATLTFPAGVTTTIANALTLQGEAGQLLSLRSSTDGAQWSIDPQGTRTIGYLDVKDSNNISATNMGAESQNSVDSGNNTQWFNLVAPTVTTQAVTGIATTTATGNGTITALGVPNPTSHGVCWSTSAAPTIAGTCTDNGAVSAAGAFTASMTGLTAGTTYHCRAYATNTFGTSYGEDQTFTTLQAYEVSYDANGATSGTAPTSQTKTQDVALTLATNSGNLAKTGFTFAGWNTAADGTGTDYAEGASYTANAALMLYAKWTADTYAVTYDANDATSGSAPGAQSKTHDVALTLATNSGNLAKTGFTFAGWNTAADGTGTDYAEGASYTANAALTLYAKWTVEPVPSPTLSAWTQALLILLLAMSGVWYLRRMQRA